MWKDDRVQRCKECGCSFPYAYGVNKKYCSNACRQMAYRRRKHPWRYGGRSEPYQAPGTQSPPDLIEGVTPLP